MGDTRALTKRAFDRAWPLVSLMLLVSVIAIGSLGLSLVWQRAITNMLISMVLVIGLYIFAGNSGLLSFGHTSFVAVGAYVAAIVTVPSERKTVLLPDLPSFLQDTQLGPVGAALAAGLTAAVFAAVIGVPLMRLNGIAASLGLFAVLVIVITVARNWDEVTRGTRTMLSVPTDTTTMRALIVVLGAMVVAFLFQGSRVGLRLRASREEEIAARSVGVSIFWDRWYALVISAFVTGVGGFLMAQYLGSFNPDVFWIALTFLIIAMLVVGGMKSLAGAVIGTILVSLFAEAMRHAENGVNIGFAHIPGRVGIREVSLALLMLGVLLFRSNGLTGGREVPPLSSFRLRQLVRGDQKSGIVQPQVARGGEVEDA